jgi:RNA polymerase sigma factor (sigma-70 family)
MSGSLVVSPSEPDLSNYNGSDAQIVEKCLDGDQEAWSVLLDKYQKLIRSIPPKYGATPDDAADIFQTVSLDLFSDLPKLREPQALRAWLIQVTSRKCLQWKEARQRRAEDDLSEIESNLPESLIVSPTLLELEEGEEEQRLREAVARLPDRFRELVRMLFYDQPPRPYKEIAAILGLARGSIPFLRARCLKRLQQILVEMEMQCGPTRLHP